MELQPIEHDKQRILTTAQIAAAYGANTQIIVNNFNRHKERYTLGKHYYALEGEDKRQFLDRHQFDLGSKNAKTIYLWTDKGALMHAKSLNTDKAWEVYEALVDSYYRVIRLVAPVPTVSDAIRKRAIANEQAVPDDCFSVLTELARDLYFWERFLNGALDNKAQAENSVGKCWSNYVRSVLQVPDQVRRTYRHVCPSGRIVQAWAYPLKYLPVFRRWLREVYFIEKFEAYAQYRAKRLGVAVPPVKKLTGGVSQLELFPQSTSA